MTVYATTSIEGYRVWFTKPWRIYDARFGSTLGLMVDSETVMTKEVRLNRKPRPDGQDNMAGELVFELHKLVRDYERRLVQELLDAQKADPE